MGKSKSKKQISTFLGLISFVLGIVALLLFALLPMLKMTIQNVGEGTLGGFGMIFGGTVNAVSGDVSEEIDGIAVNVVALIAFIVLALGLIAVAVGTFKKSKIINLVSCLLFVVAGILMFCVVDSSLNAVIAGLVGMEPGDFGYDTAVSIIKELANPSLGIGAILGGVVSILGGASSAVSALK